MFDVGKYNFLYLVVLWNTNRAGSLIAKELREQVVEDWKINNKMIMIKLVIGGCTSNIVCPYTPLAGLGKEDKK